MISFHVAIGHTVCLALLILVGCGSESTSSIDATTTDSAVDGGVQDAVFVPAADPHAFRTVGELETSRYAHTATLLANGNVVVIGGENQAGTEILGVEVYDTVSETWTSVGSAPRAFRNHSATLLASGNVLVVGGGPSNLRNYPSGNVTAEAWLLDPSTWTWTETDALEEARSHHKAIALHDGRVLIVGGSGSELDVNPDFANALAGAEIYEPNAGTFSAASAMTTARSFHAVTLLHTGEVLVVGGADSSQLSFTSSEIYDPTTNIWRTAGSLTSEDRFRHTLVTLPSGHALVAAGKQSNITFLSSTQIFDGEIWHASASLERGGNAATLTLLQSGRALFVGGYDRLTLAEGYVYGHRAQLYDEGADTWTTVAALQFPRTLHTSTLLNDGRVLVVGGLGTGDFAIPFCEITE